VNANELAGRYPTLYHMAEEANWPGIQDRGLLSSSALLDLYGYSGADRERLEGRWRPEKATIRRQGLPPAIIRDQKPLNPNQLAPLLRGGMTVEDWYRLINRKVFFWAEWKRLDWLLGARAYRGEPHVVIKVDTRTLIDQCAGRTTLTSMNSGSALPSSSGAPAPPRGLDTFVPLDSFSSGRAIVEVAVDGKVDGFASVANSAEIWIKQPGGQAEMLRTLWTGPAR
jgi:hypothetical protein